MAFPDASGRRGAGRAACRIAAAALAITVLATGGCESRPAAEPAELRVAALPDQAPAQVRRQHQPLLDSVCAAAHVACRWVEVKTYEELVELFGRGAIDLAFFGGATFVQASHRHGAVPLAMRDIDYRFTSSVLVREDSPVRRLEDLRGGAFAFGARSSTSGHFMARYFLRRQGVEPERRFERVVYSDSHDRTLSMIAAGEASAGAVNSSIAYDAIRPGGEMHGRLRVVWQSPPYADYVWAARRQVPEALRQRLTDAFLDLDHATPAHRLALERQHARGYIPAYDEDFAAVRAVLSEQGAL